MGKLEAALMHLRGNSTFTAYHQLTHKFRAAHAAAMSWTLTLLSVVAALANSNTNQLFRCSSDPFSNRPIDPILREGFSFSSPCSCQEDWNQKFCNHSKFLLTGVPGINYPTICICRKFHEQSLKCEQFISRCFKRSENECSCCFNQPDSFCDHLACSNNEPQFGSSNITCKCHHNPRDYPFQICNKGFSLNNVGYKPTTMTEQALSSNLAIFGTQIPTSLLVIGVLGLLLFIFIVTSIVLIIHSRRATNNRREVSRQRQAAHEALLQQQAEEDKYLPSV